LLANRRVVWEVELQAGHQTASSFAPPELWALREGLAESSRPAFWRGDGHGGTERALQAAEQRHLPSVFQRKQTSKVKQLSDRWFGQDTWVEAGQSWQGLSTERRLAGWSPMPLR
jgi:hypothetical protein